MGRKLTRQREHLQLQLAEKSSRGAKKKIIYPNIAMQEIRRLQLDIYDDVLHNVHMHIIGTIEYVSQI